jgi:GNAT superfamily N-acetyltransferase
MGEAYEVTNYRPDFKDQVLELQKHLWSPDTNLNRAYFEWKYEQNPYVSDPLIYLALHHGKVVGMRGMCGAKWQVGCPPITFDMPYADDLVIAPEHRNRGLFTRIMKAACDDLAHRGYKFVISFGGRQITVIGSLTMGWKSVGSMAPVGFHARYPAVFRKVRGAIRRLPYFWQFANTRVFFSRCERQPFVHLDRKAYRVKRVNRFVSLSRIPRPAPMAQVVDCLPCDGRIRHLRDTEYFAWRFRNPKQDYRFLYWEGHQLEGYLVLQQGVPAGTDNFRVQIMDWEGATEEARSGLLSAAVGRGRFAELAIWTISLPADTMRLLRNMGFTPIDLPHRERGHPTALVRPVRDEDLTGNWIIDDRRLLDVGNWDLRMLYHD